MKRFVTAGCLLIFILAMFPWPAFSEETPDQPQLIIQERQFNFGQVKEGDRITHDFIVQNKGKATLQIKKVSPG